MGKCYFILYFMQEAENGLKKILENLSKKEKKQLLYVEKTNIILGTIKIIYKIKKLFWKSRRNGSQ